MISTNFSMVSGDTKVLKFALLNENGQPKDLTGCEMSFFLKLNTEVTESLVSKGATTGVSLSNPSGGMAEVELFPEDTKGWEGVYFYKLRSKDAQGHEYTEAIGFVSMSGL